MNADTDVERRDAAFDHEVRNSINGVLMSLEALRTTLGACDVVPPAATRFLESVADQCQHLAQLLADGRPRATAESRRATRESSATEPAPAESGGVRGAAPAPREPITSSGTTSDPGQDASAGSMRHGYIAHLPTSSPMTQPRILIADDEPAIAAGLSAVLADLQYDVEIVEDGEQALLRLASERFGLVLADLKMPRVDGLTLLKELQHRAIPTECIIITGQASIGSAVQAMQSGAYDYIEKPLNAEKLGRLKALIPKALDKYAVRERNRELSSQLQGLTHYAELTGASEAMREVYRIIDAVAPSTANVLILGESGTGKELVARALHSKSERSKGPFFALNCAALPKEILENELFGHEKGAFTGSTNEKPGAFEMASGGTLFLDEVAEMPPDIQVKLLRGIETRMVRRLGGKKEIQVDIRVVAATNKDLQSALDDGDLRDDLYYRLAVVELYLPPLRERAGDIQLLANEFLARFAAQNGKAIMGFDEAAMEWILTYSWPGNVRDLKNAVERAVVLARGPVITTSELMPRHLRVPASPDAQSAVTLPAGSSLKDARRHLAVRTFASTGGDVERAAKVLGIAPAELRADLLAILQETSPAREERPSGPARPAAVAATEAATRGGAALDVPPVPADGAVGDVVVPPGVSPIAMGGSALDAPLVGAGAEAGATGRLGRPVDKTAAKRLVQKRTR
jgi:DNA-binding NtrC family response regulator